MADIGQSIRERPLIVAGGSYSHLPEDRPLDDPDRGKTYQHLSFPPALKSSKPGIYPAGQGRSRPSILGNGMVSRTWESPQIQATVRSSQGHIPNGVQIHIFEGPDTTQKPPYPVSLPQSFSQVSGDRPPAGFRLQSHHTLPVPGYPSPAQACQFHHASYRTP